VIQGEAEGDNKFQCTEGKKDKANHNPKSWGRFWIARGGALWFVWVFLGWCMS